MNKTLTALKLAEEALDIAANKPMWDGIKIRSALAAIREELSDHSGDDYENMTDDELADLQFTRAIAREALAQPVKQEPVAYFLDVKAGCSSKPSYEQVPDEYKNHADVFPLYAAPLAQQDTHATHVVRTKDLTDDEIDKVLRAQEGNLNEQWFFNYARAVIAAYKEKNNVK